MQWGRERNTQQSVGSEGFLTQPGEVRDILQRKEIPSSGLSYGLCSVGSSFCSDLKTHMVPSGAQFASKNTSNHPGLAINQLLLRACTMLKSQLQLYSTGWCHAPTFHEGSKEKPVQKGQEELRSSLALPPIGSDSGMQQEPDCKNTGQVSLAVTEPVSSSVKIGIMVPMGYPELHRG